MYDFNCQTSENKLRRFFVQNVDLLDDLMKVKQADFSGCMDDISDCPTNVKWRALLAKMREENVPFSVKGLAVTGKELWESGVEQKRLSEVLRALLLHVAVHPTENKKSRLLRLAKRL